MVFGEYLGITAWRCVQWLIWDISLNDACKVAVGRSPEIQEPIGSVVMRRPATGGAALTVTDASSERRCSPENVPESSVTTSKVPPSALNASYISCGRWGPWIQPLAAVKSVYWHQANTAYTPVQETAARSVSVLFNLGLCHGGGLVSVCVLFPIRKPETAS